MLKPLLKKAIPLLAMIPLLGSCSLFQPKTKVIEYDEEVKLHDGSMIWVHIKRHYVRSSGCEISNCFQGYEKGWGAKEVEISWDTGFPNVGRKSVFFDSYVGIIDKFENNWFVIGNNTNQDIIERYSSINCDKIGIIYQQRCIVKLNQEGKFVNAEPKELYLINQKNIIYPVQIKDWGSAPIPLDGQKLTWIEKIKIQDLQPVARPKLGTPIFNNGVTE